MSRTCDHSESTWDRDGQECRKCGLSWHLCLKEKSSAVRAPVKPNSKLLRMKKNRSGRVSVSMRLRPDLVEDLAIASELTGYAQTQLVEDGLESLLNTYANAKSLPENNTDRAAQDPPVDQHEPDRQGDIGAPGGVDMDGSKNAKRRKEYASLPAVEHDVPIPGIKLRDCRNTLRGPSKWVKFLRSRSVGDSWVLAWPECSQLNAVASILDIPLLWVALNATSATGRPQRRYWRVDKATRLQHTK